jgi:hypothetical protein
VLEPRSRRPRTSPSRVSEDINGQALAVRAALESSGLDHGPISVHDKMKAMGLDAFDRIYNTQRPHHGLPGRTTPQVAWDATDKAEAPRPRPHAPAAGGTTAHRLIARSSTPALRRAPEPSQLAADTSLNKLTSIGTFWLDGVHYRVNGKHGLRTSWSSQTATASLSLTSMEKSSSSTPAQHLASSTSATTDPRACATSRQKCHPCPDAELSPMS